MRKKINEKFTLEELDNAIHLMKIRKSPGPDEMI